MGGRKLAVAFIGVEPELSWAAVAHIPALRAMTDRFVIAGLANTSPESSRRAAAACGIERAFDSVDALVSDPAVDIVVVTVKVPAHLALVSKALDAGKHVYCEWPLGNGLAEAEALAEQARRAGVCAMIGTQARQSPAVLKARELVASGYVGEVLSSTIVGSGLGWGAMTDQRNAYTSDVATGASMLTIPFGHTMAAVTDVLGPLTRVSGLLETRRKRIALREDGREIDQTAPDQVLVMGQFGNGVPLSVHYRGGMPADLGFMWEINGSDGYLKFTGQHGNAQMVALELQGAHGSDRELRPIELDRARPFAGLGSLAENVANLYSGLYEAITTGAPASPSFDDAVQLHRLIAAIEKSAASGCSVTL